MAGGDGGGRSPGARPALALRGAMAVASAGGRLLAARLGHCGSVRGPGGAGSRGAWRDGAAEAARCSLRGLAGARVVWCGVVW